VSEIRAVLDEGDPDRIRRVRSYERSHKNRSGVIAASERELQGVGTHHSEGM